MGHAAGETERNIEKQSFGLCDLDFEYLIAGKEHFTMDLDIEGKTALVSGGGGGIGKVICSSLAQEGAKVAICDSSEAALEQAVKNIGEVSSSKVIGIKCDIKKLGEVQKLVAEVRSAFGAIDILVNSVGNPPTGSFLELSDEVWKEAMELKFFGYVRMCREVVPHMIEQRHGRIINIIGASGKKAGRENYCGGSVNAALMILTANLASEMGKWNILVNGICPGPVMTEMWKNRAERVVAQKGISMEEYMERITAEIPVKRIAMPEDVASLAVYLASGRAKHISGTCIMIDGGMSKSI